MHETDGRAHYCRGMGRELVPFSCVAQHREMVHGRWHYIDLRQHVRV